MHATVDGRNPAPPGILSILGKTTYQELPVFFHQQYLLKMQNLRFFSGTKLSNTKRSLQTGPGFCCIHHHQQQKQQQDINTNTIKVHVPKVYLVGGWKNPSEKYARQIGSFTHVGVKIKHIWKHHLGIVPTDLMMFNTSTPETVRLSPEGKLDDMPPPNSDAGNHAGATQDSPDDTCSSMDALCHPKIYQEA